MQFIEQIADMRRWSAGERRHGRRIVFVPTMGSLHDGHLCLVRDARTRGERVVVSIFVNPMQFGPSEDFAKYPRDLERDRTLLESLGSDVLFHPTVAEIYPDGYQTHIEVENLSLPLCGTARPGHFRGVATVVAKLFNIVRPHVAIFGEKDFQQLQVVRRLVRDLSMDIEIVGHPIVREADGLAMSSRNEYLTAEERAVAPGIYAALRMAAGAKRAGDILRTARRLIGQISGARIDYLELVDAETIEPARSFSRPLRLAVAVFLGKARLIDNIAVPSRR
jgi:pantoate--beta-alanine ligase